MRMLDEVFLRPIAHRGLHDHARGLVENTAPAFEAAASRGFGIECDLRPAADGTPVVFHDETLDRLTEATGAVGAFTPAHLRAVRYRDGAETILRFADLLDLVDGRVPLLVEIKSEWTPPDAAFLGAIARAIDAYRGPLALMSFDPAVIAVMRTLSPATPRGIVSGSYDAHGDWWPHILAPDRRVALRELLESRAAQPDFYAYEVDALPTPVTRFVREVLGLPLLAWTVRTPDQRARASRWADAQIFEGWLPQPGHDSAIPGRT